MGTLLTDGSHSCFMEVQVQNLEDPDFADVLKDVETKYPKVHLLVGELLKEKGFTEGQKQ
jgi:hypothetical protein